MPARGARGSEAARRERRRCVLTAVLQRHVVESDPDADRLVVVERPQRVVQMKRGGRRPWLLDERLVVPDAHAADAGQLRDHLSELSIEEDPAEVVVRAPQLQPLRVRPRCGRCAVFPLLLIDRVGVVDGRELEPAGADAAALLHRLIQRLSPCLQLGAVQEIIDPDEAALLVLRDHRGGHLRLHRWPLQRRKAAGGRQREEAARRKGSERKAEGGQVAHPVVTASRLGNCPAFLQVRIKRRGISILFKNKE